MDINIQAGGGAEFIVHYPGAWGRGSTMAEAFRNMYANVENPSLPEVYLMPYGKWAVGIGGVQLLGGPFEGDEERAYPFGLIEVDVNELLMEVACSGAHSTARALFALTKLEGMPPRLADRIERLYSEIDELESELDDLATEVLYQDA
jgi:hypothetical protein